MESRNPALSVTALASSRGERQLFEDISFDLDEGQAVQVHVVNGSGKTTLLRILCGLTLPSAGFVMWRGTDIDGDPGPLRSELAYVGHADGVKLELTPTENLHFTRALGENPTGQEISRILARLGLAGQEHVLTRSLSAGQRRRVALARLLVTRAVLWILDEPFTALDRKGGDTVQSMLTEHLSGGGIAVFSSHQPVSVPGHTVRGVELT